MTDQPIHPDDARGAPPSPARPAEPAPLATTPDEKNGPRGPEPTRYGDWERKGIAVDF